MSSTTVEELSVHDLEDLGIYTPRDFVDAFRNDEDTITVRVYDPDGASMLDNPSQDQSGEDAWEWIEWDNGHERNEWIEANFCCQECGAGPGNDDEPCVGGHDESDKHIYPDAFRPGLDFWIERYTHGLVRYAPTGESSQIDRQWDVAPGVAILRFTKPETFGVPLIDIARGICEEYTSWCNGDCYGMIRYERVTPSDPLGILRPEDFEPRWEQTDSCWGFLGSENAEEVAKHGDY